MNEFRPSSYPAPAPDLESQRKLRIVLPGGSGQVGQMLARRFQQRGHLVTILTRGPYSAEWQTVHWDGVNPGPWTETLEGADVCINLTGHTINCWPSFAKRQAIWESRITSTELLHRVISQLDIPPKLWMNASAATLYDRAVDAHDVDLPLDEKAYDPESAVIDLTVWRRSRGFLPRLVRDWEASFFAVDTPGTRKIALRSAVTFSPTPGNVFAVLSRLTRLSLGGAAGSGRQFLPWIHEADYASAIEFLIAREDLDGPFNLVAPNPLPNRDFMAALCYAWDVPNAIPAPSLAIRLGALLMNSNPELVLGSCRAVPYRLLEAGFHFQYPNWPQAAEDLVRQWKARS